MKVKVILTGINNQSNFVRYDYSFTLPNGKEGQNSVHLVWFTYRNTLARVKKLITKKLKRSVLLGMEFELEV